MKVVINKCHGGFGLSDLGVQRYAELKGINLVMEESNENFGGSVFYLDGIKDDKHYFNQSKYALLNYLRTQNKTGSIKLYENGTFEISIRYVDFTCNYSGNYKIYENLCNLW